MPDPVAQQAPGRPPEGDPHHVLAASGIADERTRVLKHGDTFAVFDYLGQIKPGGLGEEGLYHDGTRYLSRLILELDGQAPFFLGSTVRDENDQLSVALTNPDRIRDRRVEVPIGTLHLAVRTLLWQAACHWRLRARNHGPNPVTASICLRFRADFADIFEVRGMRREARGSDLLPDIAPGRVTLEYVGLDGQRRRTLLRFTPARPDRAALPGAGARHRRRQAGAGHGTHRAGRPGDGTAAAALPATDTADRRPGFPHPPGGPAVLCRHASRLPARLSGRRRHLATASPGRSASSAPRT